MFASADLLCQHGSEFLEVGLGLGLSALRIAFNPRTRRHRVIEKYREVIDLFRDTWARLAQRYESLHGINWDQVLLDGSKKPSKKGASRPAPAR